MKIGIDARFFGPESKGLGRYTQKLIEHLERIDHGNDYVVFLMRENYDLYKPKNPRFTKVLADYRWYTWKEQILFPYLLKREQCDFVHFPHFNVPLFYRKSFIVTIHDLILLRFPTHESSTRNKLIYHIKFLIYRVVIRHAIRSARHIIAVSEFTKKDILEHYDVAENEVSVTYEAGPEDVTHPALVSSDMDLVLGALGICKDYILYVGNAYPHKNLNALVDAFALWREKHQKQSLQLVLVGRDDYFYKRLQRYIDTKRIENIIILHTVTDEVLTALYKKSRAFIFPSLYEGFGLPPLEACAYGTPVLSSEASCMPEILGQAVLYVDTNDIDAFANSINTIVCDDSIREKLKRKGPEQAGLYTWEKTAKETHHIYKKIMRMV